jgi:hypothetical protein
MIKSIDLQRPSSWRDKVFLTLDIDWAHDEVIAHAADLLEAADVSATWFVTHDTPQLARLRANPRFELGIHPNFNWLLQGEARQGRTAKEVVERLLRVVPEAVSVRSHSMTQSSGLLQLFAELGLTHDANQFVPASAAVGSRPWVHWTGVTRVPYFWEDDVFCVYRERGVAELDVVQALAQDGLKVFDFHPIHLYLNTEHMHRYERTRSLHGLPAQLREHRHAGDGAASWLAQVMAALRRQEA